MFDPAGDGDLAPGAVLRVGVVDAAGGPALLLRYRTDVLDGEAAARIAGYHLTALTLIATDPDADHHDQTLLSAEELRFQLDGLAGSAPAVARPAVPRAVRGARGGASGRGRRGARGPGVDATGS